MANWSGWQARCRSEAVLGGRAKRGRSVLGGGLRPPVGPT